jgi:hypothetical protein
VKNRNDCLKKSMSLDLELLSMAGRKILSAIKKCKPGFLGKSCKRLKLFGLPKYMERTHFARK